MTTRCHPRNYTTLTDTTNHCAVERDRATWRMTASALLALYRDTGDVLRAANEREAERSLAGLASRVIAEMALSTRAPPVPGPTSMNSSGRWRHCSIVPRRVMPCTMDCSCMHHS